MEITRGFVSEGSSELAELCFGFELTQFLVRYEGVKYIVPKGVG